MYQEDFPRFLEPLKDFLLSYSPESLKVRTCSPSTTFADALLELVVNKKRQLWMVDSDGKPTSVVTMNALIVALMTAEANE